MSLYQYIFGGKVAKKAYRLYTGSVKYDSVDAYIQLVADFIWCIEIGATSRFTMIHGTEEEIQDAIGRMNLYLHGANINMKVDLEYEDGYAKGDIEFENIAKQYIGY